MQFTMGTQFIQSENTAPYPCLVLGEGGAWLPALLYAHFNRSEAYERRVVKRGYSLWSNPTVRINGPLCCILFYSAHPVDDLNLVPSRWTGSLTHTVEDHAQTTSKIHYSSPHLTLAPGSHTLFVHIEEFPGLLRQYWGFLVGFLKRGGRSGTRS